MIKTKFGSYCINDVAEGCKMCVRGEKLVLFITGICDRNCKYCSLSNLRKNKDDIWTNERKINSIKEMIEEVKESHAKGAGITGGNPLLKLDRTIEYASALKKEFGKEFHIHIYLPTNLVDCEKLEKLSRVIDEVRFHAEFLNKDLNYGEIEKEIEKLKLAGKFFKKESIGIELPMIPDKEQKIFEFIKKVSPYIGFVNLNEFEVGESNIDFVTDNYNLEEGGYIISGSKKAGINLLKKLEEQGTNLKVHFCTANTKNRFQYANRLKKHDILPYGHRNKEGTVIYLIVNDRKEFEGLIKKYPEDTYYDKIKDRIIISEGLAKRMINKISIERVEEFPTFDRIEVECEKI